MSIDKKSPLTIHVRSLSHGSNKERRVSEDKHRIAKKHKMPHVRPEDMTPEQLEKHRTNKERAFVAASRRSDRSMEARMQSARNASMLHKERTGRGLKISEKVVAGGEMYESEDDTRTPAGLLIGRASEYVGATRDIASNWTSVDKMERDFDTYFGDQMRNQRSRSFQQQQQNLQQQQQQTVPQQRHPHLQLRLRPQDHQDLGQHQPGVQLSPQSFPQQFSNQDIQQLQSHAYMLQAGFNSPVSPTSHAFAAQWSHPASGTPTSMSPVVTYAASPNAGIPPQAFDQHIKPEPSEGATPGLTSDDGSGSTTMATTASYQSTPQSMVASDFAEASPVVRFQDYDPRDDISGQTMTAGAFTSELPANMHGLMQVPELTGQGLAPWSVMMPNGPASPVRYSASPVSNGSGHDSVHSRDFVGYGVDPVFGSNQPSAEIQQTHTAAEAENYFNEEDGWNLINWDSQGVQPQQLQLHQPTVPDMHEPRTPTEMHPPFMDAEQ